MEPALKRHELEDSVEAQLLEIAQTLIPDSPGKEDLHAAKDYFPSFFGGAFPHLGLAVTRTQGRSTYKDKPTRPGLLIAEVRIYHPSLPIRGAQNPQDDLTGEAKRITRNIRGLFLEKVLASRFGANIEVADSRGGDMDELGNARPDERGTHILWIDLTELRISA